MELFNEGFDVFSALILSPIFTAIGGLLMWRFKYRQTKREDIKGKRDSFNFLLEELDRLTNDLIEGKVEGIRQKEIILELEQKMDRLREQCSECYHELFHNDE